MSKEQIEVKEVIEIIEHMQTERYWFDGKKVREDLISRPDLIKELKEKKK